MRSKRSLRGRRQYLERSLLNNTLVMRGSIVETYRTCGKQGCRCQKGDKHGPYYLLTWSENGKARSCHIPRAKVAEARKMVESYRQASERLRELGDINRQLVLEVE